MADKSAVALFKEAFFTLLEETFENVRGVYLDDGDSLFETLDGITAEVASQPVSARCASIAAQVEHVNYYIGVLERYIREQPRGEVNWDDIWDNVVAVTPEEWEASKNRLRASYDRLRALAESFDGWDGEHQIGGAMAILMHTAYHLGEIRQATCTLM